MCMSVARVCARVQQPVHRELGSQWCPSHRQGQSSLGVSRQQAGTVALVCECEPVRGEGLTPTGGWLCVVLSTLSFIPMVTCVRHTYVQSHGFHSDFDSLNHLSLCDLCYM